MMYAYNLFSKNGLETLTAIPECFPGGEPPIFGEGQTFSEMDLAKIRARYECPDTHVPKCTWLGNQCNLFWEFGQPVYCAGEEWEGPDGHMYQCETYLDGTWDIIDLTGDNENMHEEL